jgi:uncharacterized protein
MDNEILRRDPDLDFDPTTVPRDWCAGDTYSTTFMGALSLLFPEGEQFFVTSVKQLRHAVTDPALQRQVAGFIGQEAMHGKEHRLFNELLVAHGHTEAPSVEAQLRWFLRGVKKVFSKKSQLAITCALEHFTAMLAEQLLSEPRMREEIDPQVRPLWTWHSLEEVEHKAVAFEVYRAAGGGYFRRIAIMMLTSIAFFVIHPLAHMRLMARRRILWKPWRWARGMTRLWIWPAYFVRLVPAYLSYYRPGFHPDDRDSKPLVAHWREQLFGREGTLRAQTTIAA